MAERPTEMAEVLTTRCAACGDPSVEVTPTHSLFTGASMLAFWCHVCGARSHWMVEMPAGTQVPRKASR